MSDPGNTPEAPPTLIEQDGAVPETVIPAEPVVETPAAEPEAPAPEAKAEEAAKPKQKPWWQDRIDEQTRKRRDAERERDELAAKLAENAPADPETPAFDPKNFESLVDQAAERKLAQRQVKDRTESWFKAGQTEFGGESFNEKCNMVAAMGAGDSPEFMAIITDSEIIPDGHKVVAALADHPEEAQRILSLGPVKMAAALTRFAATNSVKAPEAPISQAPAPIKPIGGSAKASGPDDSQDIKTWLANRNATARTTAGGQANRH